MLKDLELWHASKETYDKEALGSDTEKGFDALYFGMRLEGTRYLDWQMFRNMCYKWHRRLTKVSSARPNNVSLCYLLLTDTCIGYHFMPGNLRLLTH
jgi:hypothetical protein